MAEQAAYLLPVRHKHVFVRLEFISRFTSRKLLPALPITMTTASQMAPDVVVPKITLPSTDGKSAGNVENAAFRRQLPVALGRSHSQRTPRKDVIFSVRQGTMLEKQRFHVLGSSPATKKYHDESQSIEGQSAKAQKPSSTDR